MPQLTSMATIRGAVDKFFKCPYQANVMNRFEQINSKIVCASIGMFLVAPA